MLPELTTEEFSAALDEVARMALAHLAQADPPVDALELARRLGLSVTWDERQPGRGRTARLAIPGGGTATLGGAGAVHDFVADIAPDRRRKANGFANGGTQGAILLRPDPRRERLHWTIAHEIGEIFAHRVFAHLGVDPRETPPNTRETIANQLAGRLLLPRDTFASDARASGWDLLALKERYTTASHELIARRMLDFAPPIIITIIDQGRRTLRRGNLPFRLPAWSELEAEAWRLAHEQLLPVARSAGNRTVQAWPIHEPEWKREIVRTEFEEALGELSANAAGQVDDESEAYFDP
jgi:hypothetical protein